VFGNDQQLGVWVIARGRGEFLEREDSQRGSDGHPTGEAFVGDGQRGVTSEGPTAQHQWLMGPEPGERIDGGNEVSVFGPTPAVVALGGADSPEVEPQHADAALGQQSEEFAGHQRDHRATLLRMGMGENDCAADRAGLGGCARWESGLGFEAEPVGGGQSQGGGPGVVCHGRRRYRRGVSTSQTVEMLSEGVGRSGENLPIKMLNDRVLVDMGGPEGERRSTGGILIPATAQIGKRLVWAEVVAVGPNVRSMETGDQVLFNPEDRYEVEVRGNDYVILRERDVHAVAAERLAEGSTGLYL